MKKQHTQGHWEATLNESKCSWTISSWKGNESYGHIAYINAGVGEASEPQVVANAKLIAAAPELLEALNDVLEALPDSALLSSEWKKAQSAIKKATE